MKLKLWHGICAAFGMIGALFGGFDGALTTLIVFMCVDFAMGLTVAAVFGTSQKSEGADSPAPPASRAFAGSSAPWQ